MENSNVVNDTQSAVVESTPNDSVDTSGASSETSENSTKPEIANRNQTKSENRAFADMRRQKESSEAAMNNLIAGLQKLGYQGDSPESILEQMEAQKANMTVEQLRESKAAKEKAVRDDPMYKEMERKFIEYAMQQDLAEIREIDPSVQDIKDLSDDFFKLRAAGIAPKVAYKAIMDGEKPMVSKPVNLGPVGETSVEDDQYYTSKELDTLTSKDLENPKIFKKAMESLKRL